jgi:hypothetical protein
MMPHIAAMVIHRAMMLRRRVMIIPQATIH